MQRQRALTSKLNSSKANAGLTSEACIHNYFNRLVASQIKYLFQAESILPEEADWSYGDQIEELYQDVISVYSPYKLNSSIDECCFTLMYFIMNFADMRNKPVCHSFIQSNYSSFLKMISTFNQPETDKVKGLIRNAQKDKKAFSELTVGDVANIAFAAVRRPWIPPESITEYQRNIRSGNKLVYHALLKPMHDYRIQCFRKGETADELPFDI